ncbi:hypothetical protein SDC9_62072 [bioreactor metagenome]|uniref:Uncharacterized protein n=1 Tax=bioreactor metagenome TaxID=1076179 RepID=A0A644XIU7_9ZZZZ
MLRRPVKIQIVPRIVAVHKQNARSALGRLGRALNGGWVWGCEYVSACSRVRQIFSQEKAEHRFMTGPAADHQRRFPVRYDLLNQAVYALNRFKVLAECG